MAMAFYAEEEEVWKCPKHPSKRRRSGICPICLRDRLVTLCPDCGNARPCASCATTSTSSSSSSASSSFSLFSSSGRGGSARSSGVGAVGSVSNLMDGEPSFRRSRSVAIPFLRSKFSEGDSSGGTPARSKASIWWAFRKQKNRKEEEEREGEESKGNEIESEESYDLRSTMMMMMRSKSVSVAAVQNLGSGDAKSLSRKGRGWHFPSPMKVFRQSKAYKIVQERSPLHRG